MRKTKTKRPLMRMPKAIEEYWASLDPPRALSWERDFVASMMWTGLTKKEKDELRKIKNR